MAEKSSIEPLVLISLQSSLMNSELHNDMQMQQKSGLTHRFTVIIYCPTRKPSASSTLYLYYWIGTLCSIYFS